MESGKNLRYTPIMQWVKRLGVRAIKTHVTATLSRFSRVGLVIIALTSLVALSGCSPQTTSQPSQPDPFEQAWQEWQQSPHQQPPPKPAPPSEANKPPKILRNIGVSVERVTRKQSSQWGLDLFWQYTHGNIQVSNGPALSANGIRVGLGKDNFMGELRGFYERRKDETRNQMLLTFMDGTSGKLHIGEERWVVPFRYQNVYYSTAVLEKKKVGALLEISGKVLPNNLIELTLTPTFSKLSNDRDLKLSTLSTTVIVPHGKTLVIGGLNNSSNSVGTALFSQQTSNSVERSIITLTPRIIAFK